MVVLHTDTKHRTMWPILGMLNCHKYVGRGDPMGMVISRVSEFIQVVYTKPLDICYDFASALNLIFLLPIFGKGVPLGPTMVLLGTAMLSSHRLSVQTTIVVSTMSCNMQCRFLLGVVSPQFSRGMVIGDWRWVH